MPTVFNHTGYRLGNVLIIVFLIPATGYFAHCSKYGCFIQSTPIPEGYEEFFID